MTEALSAREAHFIINELKLWEYYHAAYPSTLEWDVHGLHAQFSITRFRFIVIP